MDNFFCNKCGNTFHVMKYSFSTKSGSAIYKDKNGKLLQCNECKSADIIAIEKDGDYSSTAFGKFSSASNETKKKILKKRSDENAKKLKDRTEYLRKNWRGTTKGLDFKQ